MTTLPFRGRGYTYRGRDERKRRLVAEKNRIVAQIAAHANRLVADNPREVQVLGFAMIAGALGCDVDMVRHALSNGGYNGITISVTEEDRAELERFKSKPTNGDCS